MAENKAEKAFIDNKLKRFGATKKTFYSLMSLIVCLLLIVVLSITQASFNKDAIYTVDFWLDFIILAGLCIFGMITGQSMGDDISRNNPSGVFRNTLNKLLGTFKKLDGLSLFAFFDDWLEIYRQKKIASKIRATLRDNGINQLEVLDLDITEINSLALGPYKKDWKNTQFEGKYPNDTTYFLTYTNEQIKVIKYCLEGKVKVSRLHRGFFVDAVNQSEKDMWESAAKSSKKKTSYLGTSYFYKIMTLLIMCIIAAGLTPGMNEDATSAQIWLSLIKRVFSVTMAFVWGIYIGMEIVKIDVLYLNFKIDILNLYYEEYNLKIYQPKSIEEVAKEQYDNASTSVKLNASTNINLNVSENKKEDETDEQKAILD